MQRLDVGVVAEVDDAVQVLQERKVGGEQTLDFGDADRRQRSELGDDTGQHEDREVRVVGAVDAPVTQGFDLIACRGETHHAVAVQYTVG